MYRIIYLAILAGLAFPQKTVAQETWDLQKCISFALENNLQIKSSGLDIELADQASSQARYLKYPSLNANTSYGANFGYSIDPFTNSFTYKPVHSNNLSLSANITLFNGFRINNQILQGQLRAEAALSDKKKRENDLVLNVATAYLRVLFNLEQLNNAKLQLKTTEEQLGRTEILVNAGRLAQKDLLDVVSQKATNEVNIINAENTLILSKLTLRQFMQLEEAAFEISVPVLNDPETTVALQTSQQIFDQALQALPEFKSAKIAEETSKLGVSIARADLYPSLTGSVAAFTGFSSQRFGKRGNETIDKTLPTGDYWLNGTNKVPIMTDVTLPADFGLMPYFSQLGDNFRQSVSLNLNIPIFNRFTAKANVANSEIGVRRAELNTATLKNQIRQTIEQVHTDVITASKSFQANKNRVEALKETLRVTKERADLGVVSAVDFNIAANNYHAAESDLIRAKYDLVFKLKILDFYLGNEIKL